MDIVVRPGSLTNASLQEYRHKGILLDVTHADPQAQVHLRNGSATSDGIAAQISEARKRQHYARSGHVSFDERSFKLTTLAVESFGRHGGRVMNSSTNSRRTQPEEGMGDQWF